MKRWPLWRGIARVLSWFMGLCTIFAAAVTAVQAWQERALAQRPQAVARIEGCALELYRYSTGSRREGYFIDCHITFSVGTEKVRSSVKSRIVPSTDRVVVRGTGPTSGQLQEWVEAHPQGTPITVHYDPARPQDVVLVETDMPTAGPHTPDNLKLLGFFAGAWALLFAISRTSRQ